MDHRPDVPFAKSVLRNITSQNDFFMELSGHQSGVCSDKTRTVLASVDDPHRSYNGLATRRSSNGSTNLVLGSELADLTGCCDTVPTKLEQRRLKRLPVSEAEAKCSKKRRFPSGARICRRQQVLTHFLRSHDGTLCSG